MSHWFLKWPLLSIICSVITAARLLFAALCKEILQAGYGNSSLHCILILPKTDRPNSKMTFHTDYCQAASGKCDSHP